MSSEGRKKEIDAQKSRVANMESALCAAKQRLKELLVLDAEFKVGQEVEARRNREWEPAIVRKVEPQSFGDWYQVSFRKKNGDWADAKQRAFNGGVREVPA